MNATALAPLRWLPVRAILVPGLADVGENEETAGAGMTVNLALLVTVPLGVVAAIVPLVAPEGTAAVAWLSEDTEKVVAAAPLNVTAERPLRCEPRRVITAPAPPVVGVKEVRLSATGASVKV